LKPPPPSEESDLIVVFVLSAGQRIGRLVVAVIDAARHDRAVGVTLDEVDQHLVADAGQEHAAPAVARPQLADADPARAGLVVGVRAVPVELHLHAPVLVGIDLLALGADHGGGLQAAHDGAERDGLGAERLGALGDREFVAVAELPRGVLVEHLRLITGVADLNDAIVAVEIVARVADQLQGVPGRDARAIAAARAGPALRLEGLEAQLGLHLALVRAGVPGVLILARILIDLELGAGLGRLRGLHGEPRLVQVEVAERDLTRAHALAEAKLCHVLAVRDHASGRIEPQRGRPGDRRVRPGVVGHHEHVLVGAVLEEVEDAVLLHQTGDESEVGFAVLHAVVARGVLAEQVEAKALGRETGPRQHLLQDVGGGEVLKDAAVMAVLQAPDPRHELGLVELEMARLADVLEGRDHARDEAWRLEPADLEDPRLVDDGGEVDLPAGELEVELEQARQALAPEESQDPQLTAARRLKSEERLVAEERAEERHQAHGRGPEAYRQSPSSESINPNAGWGDPCRAAPEQRLSNSIWRFLSTTGPRRFVQCETI
jgi:hypothetical protein